MNIHGIGTDIVSITRITRIWKKYRDNFARHILTNNEIFDLKECKDKPKFLAKRFAAKEAIVKAIGTGFRDGIWFQDLEIAHNKLGKPIVVFSGNALKIAQDNNINNTQLSISDEKEFALAFVICQTN